MIFLPHPSSYDRHDFDTPFQYFWLNPDGRHDEMAPEVVAVYLPNPSARFTLLMSHGNAEDLGDNRDLYLEYARRGFAVFAYDYRGYGQSTIGQEIPKSTEATAYRDERAAWDYMVNTLHIPPSHIIIHGTSVGCGPAVKLAADLSESTDVNQRPADLILRSPFRSAFTVLTRVPLLPWDKFNNERRIRDVRMPVLVVHGMADNVIPFTHGQRVFDNANPIGDADALLTRDGGKQHLWIPNAGHNDIFIIATETYFAKLQSFTAQLP
jgi:alpha-beta hydrolase superfamily lysophospholipase